MNAPLEIRYSANFKIVGKTDPWNLSYAGAWKVSKGTFTSLADHIGKGHPWMCAILDGNLERNAKNSNHAEIIAADIDNGLTIEQALNTPLVKNHCALGIESANSKVYDAKKNPDCHEKIRLVFRLPHPIQGNELINLCYRYLIHLLGNADEACKDASRYYFGAPGRKPFLLNESATLPESFVQDAIAWDAAIQEENKRKQAEISARLQRWRESQDGNIRNEIDIVRSALRAVAPYTPGQERYSKLIAVIGGVLRELGSEGEALLREWDGGLGQWGRGGFDRILATVERGNPNKPASLGSLFHLAKTEGGWQFPKREYNPRHKSDRPKGFAKKDAPKPVSKDVYKLSFTPDVEVCERYFPELEIPSGVKLAGIKGAKGTGKTQLLVKIVKQAHKEGRRVLVLTFREQLGMQTGGRLGIPYLVEVRLTSNEKGVVLCWDSAHPASAIAFEGADWVNADILIDESESGLWHLLSSGTIKDKKRLAIFKEVQAMLSGALSPNTKGRVFCLDADLSDLSITTVRTLGGRPELQPYTIVNTYQIQKGKLYHYPSNEELLNKCENEIAAGGKHIVLMGAQKRKSKYSSTNLEKKWQKLYPGKKILRIDSESIANREHPAYLCTERINTILLEYDVIIITSVLECGVSIDIYNHFSGVWGFFGGGVLAENSIRQFLSRLRDFDVPRHCHFAETGCNFAYVGDGSHDPKLLLENELRLGDKNTSALILAGMEVDTDGSIKSNSAALESWGKFGARLNSTFANYRAVILAGLEAEGYQIEHVEESLSEQETARLKDEIKALRAQSHAEYAEAIATKGDEIQSEAEYQKLKEKRGKTETEHCSERRYELRQRYGVPVTPELVIRDDDGWYSYLRAQYLLTVSDQDLVKQESSRLESNIFENKMFIPDINRRSVYAKIDLLKKLGMQILLDPNREFTGDSSEVQMAAAIALANADDVKLVLGITVTEDSTAMAICQEILSQTVGFRLKAQQRRVEGQRTRFYSYSYCLKDEDLSVELAERQKVFDAWREREEQREASHENPNRSLLTGSSVTRDGVTVHAEWFAPGAIADAQASLDNATDDETRELVLSLTPEHIRALLTREKPQFKAPGDRSPQRKTGRTEPRPTHLKVVPPPTIPTEVPA